MYLHRFLPGSWWRIWQDRLASVCSSLSLLSPPPSPSSWRTWASAAARTPSWCPGTAAPRWRGRRCGSHCLCLISLDLRKNTIRWLHYFNLSHIFKSSAENQKGVNPFQRSAQHQGGGRGAIAPPPMILPLFLLVSSEVSHVRWWW